MDLIGAFPNLRDLRVTHQPLGTKILDVAVAAVQLQRVGGNAHRHIRSAHFEHRRFHAKIRRTAIDHPRHMPKPGFALREIGCHIGEHELDALKLDDLAARLLALVDVVHCILERAARDAQRVCGDAGA